ncbi:uncharacterized protein [Lepisosteus oculatus]|uniref:uncharacterized protein n=1 Tax=Lepisosteus oculatus TaxID=7918 RepID=UPI0037192AAB
MENNDNPQEADAHSPSRMEALMKNCKLQKNKEEVKQRLVQSGTDFILVFWKVLSALEENIQSNADVSVATLMAYMAEVLHCIFFLGHIHEMPINPKTFFQNDRLFQIFKRQFPEPFEHYSTHLPKRTPFSILLDMVSKVKGHTDHRTILSQVEEVKKKLTEKSKDNQFVNNYSLTASVICMSYFCTPEKGFNYGASLSCSGKVETKIMIALSCIKTWNDAVAHAVCHAKKGGFIKFPDGVTCQAYIYDLKSGYNIEKAPCKKCHGMFRNVNFLPPPSEWPKGQDWQYGNCAETESLSHLLNTEQNVRNAIKAFKTHEVIINREEIVQEAKKNVTQLLNSRKFRIQLDDFKFFAVQN